MQRTTIASNNSPQRQAALDIIRHRKQTYSSVFDPDNQAARAVLSDLARFCRAGRSTFDADARVHALLEGRKEVFIRIAQYIGMSETELYHILVEGNES